MNLGIAGVSAGIYCTRKNTDCRNALILFTKNCMNNYHESNVMYFPHFLLKNPGFHGNRGNNNTALYAAWTNKLLT